MSLERRQFSLALGAAALPPFQRSARGQQGVPKPLTVIAYNIYAARGWPADRALARQAVEREQMPQRLAMELALYDPDIINFSESPSETMTQEIADILGMHHVRFPSGGNWPGTLLSHFPITSSANVPLRRARPGELFTRHWGQATLDLPHGEPLLVHSAHLYPVADSTIRLKEIAAMLKAMRDDLQANRSMLLIGDLNHTPDSEEYKMWIAAGWIDTFAKVGQGDGPTIKADQPDRRIDYVMAAGSIAERAIESRPLFEGHFRLNPDDDQAFALSDHLPQLAVFASNR